MKHIIEEVFIWCLCVLWALTVFAVVAGILVTSSVEFSFPW